MNPPIPSCVALKLWMALIVYALTLGVLQSRSASAKEPNQKDPVLLPVFDPGGKGSGYCDIDGNWKIAPQFSQRGGFFKESVAIVKDKKRWLLLKPDGSMKALVRVNDMGGPFSEGVASARSGKLYGYVDKDGNWIISPRFKYGCSFREGRAFAQSADNKHRKRPWGIIDKQGNWVCDPQFADTSSYFCGGRAFVTKVPEPEDVFQPFEDQQWQIIDTLGNIVSERKFDRKPDPFDSGLALVVDENGQQVFIDKDGNNAGPDISKFREVGKFNEGLAGAATDGELRVVWGFIDSKGNWVISPQFLRVGDYGNGVAPVKINEYYGAVDRKGDLVCPATYARIGKFGYVAPGIAEAQLPDGNEGYLTIDNKFVKRGFNLGAPGVLYDVHFGKSEAELRKELSDLSVESKVLSDIVSFALMDIRSVLPRVKENAPVLSLVTSSENQSHHYWLVKDNAGDWRVFRSIIADSDVRF